jgi:hypothetical protein
MRETRSSGSGRGDRGNPVPYRHRNLAVAGGIGYGRDLPPTRQFAPAALNAGFAPHCRRSDARGLTSQIDPHQTLQNLRNAAL